MGTCSVFARIALKASRFIFNEITSNLFYNNINPCNETQLLYSF